MSDELEGPVSTPTALIAPLHLSDQRPRQGKTRQVTAWIVAHLDFVGGVALVIACVAVLSPNIFSGGFAMDDWIGLGQFIFHGGKGFWGEVTSTQVFPARAPAAIISVIEFNILGTSSASPFLAFAALVDLVECVLMYVVLRRFCVEVAPAVFTAFIFIVLPVADSTAFWDPEWTPSFFGRLLPLLCFLLMLNSFRRNGARAVALQAGSILISVVAVFGYELGAPLIVLSGVFYFARTTRKRAALLWATNTGAVAVTLFLKPTYEAPATSIGYLIAHTKLILGHGANIIASSLVPFGNQPDRIVLGITLGLAAAGAVVSNMSKTAPDLRRMLNRNIMMLVFGVGAAGLGWLMIVPASIGYDPGSNGVQNRVNAIAAIGIAIIAVAAVGLLLGLLRFITGWRWWTSSTAVAIVLATVALGNFSRFHADQNSWTLATLDRNKVLTVLHQVVPDPKSHTTFFTFGEPGYVNGLIPVFGGGGDDDLWWAVKVSYHRDDLSGFPVFAPTPLTCGNTTVTLAGTGFSSATEYGRAIFVDIPGHWALTPRDRAQCIVDSRQLEPYAPLLEST